MITEQVTTVIPSANDKAALIKAQTQKKAADELEGYFIHQMLREMRKTVPKDTLMGGDKFSSDTYYDMLDEQIAREIVKSGGFGYSKQVLKMLDKNGSTTLNKRLLEEQYKGGVKPDLGWN